MFDLAGWIALRSGAIRQRRRPRAIRAFRFHGRDAIETGTRVRLKTGHFDYGRPHLLFHARQGDVGVVSPPSKQSPGMSRLYVIVHFDVCGHDHRLLEDELETV